MANVPIISFNSGLLSELIDARSDTEKYNSGCRILENMIPTIYGSVERRPGTKYVATSKNAGEAVRMMPFIFSSSIAYMCEFGNLYIRFYYGGARLEIAGVPVEVVTPYVIADLPKLQIKQIGDTMWIVHPDYAPRKLTRTTTTSFSLDVIVFERGPFRLRNDLDAADGVTLQSSVIALDASGTLTASGDTFETGHVGSLWQLTQPRVNVIEELSTGITAGAESSANGIAIDGQFSFITRGTWTGTVKIERNENDGGWETFRTYVGEGDRNVSLTATETEDDVFYKITAVIAGGVLNTDITVDNSTQDGIVRVDSYTSATVVNVTVVKALASTDPTTRWSEGAWSSVNGYPVTVASHGERIVYAGTASDLQTVWLSEVGNYENFDEGVDDADAFTIALTTTNDIKWADSLSTLAIGTSGDEWQLSADELYKPITPTNVSAKRQTNNGSSALQPVRASDSLLFVDTTGRRIREMTYQDLEQKLISPDMNALSYDITESGIAFVAFQNNPDAILWCTLTDGTLLSMTYERDQNVIAWAKHPIGGSGVVNSVARIPSDEEDEIWISVTRTINFVSVTYIEQMQPRAFGNQEDSFFVDAGIKYDNVATTTFSNLDHLERELVSVLGDGAVFPPKNVISGAITTDEEASVAVIGLPYEYKVKPMRIDMGNATGTSKGSIKKIAEIAVSFLNSLNAWYGDGIDDYTFDWRTEEVLTSPPELFTGDKVVVLDAGFNTEDPITISGSDPLPCTVRAIIARTEKTGR